MIAIVTDFGDFDIAITFYEFDNWQKEAPIKGDLLKEGELSCGKKIQLILEPEAKKIINYRINGIDWNHATIAELVCNQKVFEQLDIIGKIYIEVGSINILIQVSNILGMHL